MNGDGQWRGGRWWAIDVRGQLVRFLNWSTMRAHVDQHGASRYGCGRMPSNLPTSPVVR